jgi:hypothetical protein
VFVDNNYNVILNYAKSPVFSLSKIGFLEWYTGGGGANDSNSPFFAFIEIPPRRGIKTILRLLCAFGVSGADFFGKRAATTKTRTMNAPSPAITGTTTFTTAILDSAADNSNGEELGEAVGFFVDETEGVAPVGANVGPLVQGISGPKSQRMSKQIGKSTHVSFPGRVKIFSKGSAGSEEKSIRFK